ncbi:MAG: DUF58 domain-containing protein [Phycisphaera sp.]|nr:DUF58 domain-containing protein [Phycisphaera sp.]
MRIKSMELRAKVVVEGFWHGIHRSPYHGFSVEFTEYRQYSPGDDPRYIDWRVLARSDRTVIKKFEDETNVRCHMLVDHSASMAYGSRGYTKAEYAGTLAATLAWFLFGQGDAVGVTTFDDAVRDYIPARNRPGHLRQIMLTLEGTPTGDATDLAAPLKRISEMLTKRGLLVLISDLLAPVDAFEAHLAYLRAVGHEVVLFNVLDPAELSLDIGDASLIRDMESGRDLYVDPDLARKQYQQKLNEHLERAATACGNLGIDYHLLPTDRPLELALFDFFTDRMRRGREVRRAGSATAHGGAGVSGAGRSA